MVGLFLLCLDVFFAISSNGHLYRQFTIKTKPNRKMCAACNRWITNNAIYFLSTVRTQNIVFRSLWLRFRHLIRVNSKLNVKCSRIPDSTVVWCGVAWRVVTRISFSQQILHLCGKFVRAH